MLEFDIMTGAASIGTGYSVNSLLASVALAVFVVVCGIAIIRTAVRNRRRRRVVDTGLRITGTITGVKPRSGFDRKRGLVDVHARLVYSDPISGRSLTRNYRFERNYPGLPNALSGPGAGVVDVPTIQSLHRESMAWRRKLKADGLTDQQIKDAVLARAVDQAGPQSLPDAEGYVALLPPIEVAIFREDSGFIVVRFL